MFGSFTWCQLLLGSLIVAPVSGDGQNDSNSYTASTTVVVKYDQDGGQIDGILSCGVDVCSAFGDFFRKYFSRPLEILSRLESWFLRNRIVGWFDSIDYSRRSQIIKGEEDSWWDHDKEGSDYEKDGGNHDSGAASNHNLESAVFNHESGAGNHEDVGSGHNHGTGHHGSRWKIA